MTVDKNPGAENPALKLVKKLQDNKSSLHIGRIPIKSRELFVAIADEEFCSDYGMLLKYLLDKVVDNDNKAIVNKIEELEERISNLENSDLNPKDKEEGIKSLSGKKLNTMEVKHG
jgi:hypothetical protein